MAEFGRTWWGERFLEALARFANPGRLGRGRSYASNGRVTEHKLKDGTVHAKVRGSINPYFGVYEEPLYDTTIKITQISAADWTKVIKRIAARADLVTKLLQQEMPDRIEEVFAEEVLHLLPYSQNEFRTHCSCPDWDNPCKHIAGVYYLLAKDLDRDPFVLFELRGLSRDALRAELVKTPLGEVLASSLQTREIPLAPVTSFHTRPAKVSTNGTASATAPTTNGKGASGRKAAGKKAAAGVEVAAEAHAPTSTISHREFWAGARRLPPATPDASSSGARVSALQVKKQGDYPPFWQKDSSFIEVMEELYDRVRSKSPQLK
jgi:uncharacterized Zn finger protein